MKIKIDKISLINEISKMSKIISYKNNSTPAIENILVDVREKDIIFTALNDYCSIKSRLEKSESLFIEDTGKFLIKSKYFLEILKKIDNIFIELTKVDNSLLRIKADTFNSNLNILDETDFPDVTFKLNNNKILFKTKEFKKILRETSFAVGQNEKRIILTGLNFKNDNNNQILINATDSYRLAFKKYNKSIDFNFDITIPWNFINDINKLLEYNDENIDIFLNENNIIFKFSNTVIQSKLIEGKYPDTLKIIPDVSKTKIKINSRKISKIIDRVITISSNPLSTIIELEIISKDKKMIIKTINNEIGDSCEFLENLDVEGENQKISVNSHYMLEALNSFDGTEVFIEFIDDEKPVLIKFQEEDSLIQLILPVKVN